MSRMTIVLALVALMSGIADAEGDDLDKLGPPTISVDGVGRISATPDVAEIDLGVVTRADTAREALAANNEAMTALQKVVKERGVAAKDLQTTQIGVSPRYSQPAPGQQAGGEFIPRLVGYEVTNSVRITVRDVPHMGALIDAVVQAGANQVHRIAFRIDRPEKLLDEARKRAIADARRKAELYAGEASVVVGSPIRIEERGERVPGPRSGRQAMTVGLAFSTPVEPGEQELSVTVLVVYRLEKAK